MAYDTQTAQILLEYKSTGTRALLSEADLIKSKLTSTLKASVSSGNSFNESLGKMADKLGQAGRNAQWMGQRLTFGLSLPLALFGKQAIDVALEIDKAYTDLRRVWGGNADDIDSKLRPAAIRLSNTFGLAQESIVDVFSELSKADLGKTPEEMEKLARLAAETSIIFGVDLTKATDQVKSLMLGFGFTVTETAQTIDSMNIIADKTAASEQGIIDALSIMSGLARQSGMSVRELAAITAVFESNNISAAEGANALKFSISRLRTPTNAARDSMALFGLKLDSTEFKMKTSTEQLLEVAKKFKELKESSDKTKFVEFNNALADLVGRRQLSRFTVLMEDMSRSLDDSTKSSSQFAQALDVSSDASKNAEFKLKQLEVTLGAQNIQTEIAKQKFRNLQGEIGNKLLPIYTDFLNKVAKLVAKFNDMSPATQDIIIKLGIMLVALGPLISVYGSLLQVLSLTLNGVVRLSKGIEYLNALMEIKAVTATTSWGASLASLGKFLTNPWVLAIAVAVAAIGGAIWYFTKKKESINDTEYALRKLKSAEEEYANAQQTYNQANLSVIQSQERIEYLLGKINELEAAGQTTTTEYKRLVAELAVENDNLANNQQKVVQATNDVQSAQSNLSFAESYKRKLDEISGSAIGLAAGMQTAIEKTSALSEEQKKFANETIPIITNTQQKTGLIGFPRHEGGLLHASRGAIIPGASPLRDRVPVMAEQGEGIMSKKAIENLLQNGELGGSATYNFNVEIKPGMMIATPGEARELARNFYKYAVKDLTVRQGASI